MEEEGGSEEKQREGGRERDEREREIPMCEQIK